MKNRKLTILVIFILIVVFVILIKNIIFFYNVKSNFINAIYEANRNGNYHIIENVDNITKFEYTAKDGNIISQTTDKYGKDELKIYTAFESFFLYNDVDGKIGTKYKVDSVNKINPLYSFATMLYDGEDEEYIGKFGKIQKSNYEGKDCYIVEIDIENDTFKKKNMIYIDQKTYLPFLVKSEENNNISKKTSTSEIKYDISIGTVTELPEVNLDEYEIKEKEELYDD